MRHPEPAIVTEYKAGPPKVCHTCEHYANDGLCTFHFQTPPEDFAATPGACPDWEVECPF